MTLNLGGSFLRPLHILEAASLRILAIAGGRTQRPPALFCCRLGPTVRLALLGVLRPVRIVGPHHQPAIAV